MKILFFIILRFKDKIKNILFVLLSFLLVMALLGVSGCASVKQVYIPTKCEVETLPQEPRFDEVNPYENLIDLIKYLKLIKPIINECVEERVK